MVRITGVLVFILIGVGGYILFQKNISSGSVTVSPLSAASGETLHITWSFQQEKLNAAAALYLQPVTASHTGDWLSDFGWPIKVDLPTSGSYDFKLPADGCLPGPGSVLSCMYQNDKQFTVVAALYTPKGADFPLSELIPPPTPEHPVPTLIRSAKSSVVTIELKH